MQKTWSTDSIQEVVASSSKHSGFDLDRPRKHARRTSLPVGRNSARSRGGAGAGTGTGTGTGGVANNGGGSNSNSSGSGGDNQRRGNGGLAPSSRTNGHAEADRHSAERTRFREAAGLTGARRRSKTRTESMPASSSGAHSTSSGSRLRSYFAGEADDEDAIGKDEDGSNDASGRLHSNGVPAMMRLDSIESAEQSTVDSSTTYAAGPSGYDGARAFDGHSSSDASSSERHAFDWDTPQRRPAGSSVLRNHSTARRTKRSSNDVTNILVSGNGGPREDLDTGGMSTPTRPTHPVRNSDETQSDRPGRLQRGGSKRSHAKAVASRLNGALAPGMTPMSNGARARVARSETRSLFSNPVVEALLLLAGCFIMVLQLAKAPEEFATHTYEMALVVIASSLYYFGMRTPVEAGTIWATDDRNYRACGDDGAMVGLLMGPLLALTCLFATLEDARKECPARVDELHFPPWQVESSLAILGEHKHATSSSVPAIVLSRSALVSIQSLMSTVLLVHLLSTKWIRRPEQLSNSNWVKLGSYAKFSTAVTLGMALAGEVFARLGMPLWTTLSTAEIIISTHLFQSNLYAISRLARRSFTLGELTIVSTIGMTLTVETINITSAKFAPASTLFVKTFRRPTPLLVFQLALVVGTFMIGFMLSPLLYLSRHLAQKPLHRLRWPHKRDLHRRLLAFFFYLFASLYVIGVLGLWVWWLLGKRNPWMWTLRFIIGGTAWWSRPLLITYWIALVSISIAGWQATVLGGRRFRLRAGHNTSSIAGSKGAVPGAVPSSSSSTALTAASNEQESTSKSRTGAGSGERQGTVTPSSSGHLFPKRAAYLSLNARRKFFHALAVLLFTPGIAYDPAFMHLAFSLAFSVFIFAEYIRYYALLPFGAAFHVFLSEFTDHKDSGPVILSHFYLLTGCAGTVWIEGLRNTWRTPSSDNGGSGLNLASWPWRLLAGSTADPEPTVSTAVGSVDIAMFIGVLTLGIADAVASIVGRRYGRLYWPSSGKTLEGSLAFMSGLFSSALLLRTIGWCAQFSLPRFAAVTVILGVFEGISNQNDNLVLPLYGSVALSIFGI